MNNIMNILEKYILPFADKIGNQKHLQAVRNGVIMTLPLTIVGSFFVIFLNIPIEGYMNFINPYRNILDIPFRFTVGMMALYCSFSIAVCLGKNYKLDSISCGFLGVLAFLCSSTVPTIVTQNIEGVISAGRFINIGQFSASNLFSAILCSLISVEIYRVMKEKKITIKMPEGVPEGVANSFGALLPALVVIVVFWGIRHWLNVDINSILTNLLMPLKQFLVGNSLLGGLITVFLICFFWVLGIHGPAILGPIIRPMWDSAIADNMEAFTSGVPASDLPYIFTEQFLQWFIWIGGSGLTLPLVCFFLFSKSKYLSQLGKLSIIPGVFNINEPIIFGAPIVLNPILAIPFIITPLVATVVAYLFTYFAWVPLMMARLPFTLPAPLAAIISTDWTLMAGLLVCLNFVIGLVIYYPFFKRFEKINLEAEQNNHKNQ
ncbi:MAG: PTS sugar transporter subunit IIC [Brevinema sp.]